MESWKCDVCAKYFTGLVCFQQHEASEKHKKKVRQVNGVSFEMPKPVNPPDLMHQNDVSFEMPKPVNPPDLMHQNVVSSEMPKPVNPPDLMHQVHCDTCKVSISGWENYQKHVNSLEHAIMIQKQNNDLLSSSVSSTFELKAERSQPMVSTVSLTGPTRGVASFAECKPCQKEFSGPEPYQQHLASAGHRKKFGPVTQIMQNDETDSIVKKDNINDNPQSSVSTCNLSKTVPQFFAKCDICEMQFGGPVPYQVHLVSDGHKMKAANQPLGNLFSDAYKCHICVMSFTGPVPYQQHLVSNGHKKKINAADLSKQLAATGSLSPPDSTLKNSYISHEQSSINDLRKWYCDLCKKQSSGPIPYNTHIIGREHSKNVRIRQVEENLRKIKVSGPLPYVGNNEIGSGLSNEVTSTINLPLGCKTEIEESSVNCKINDLNINVKSDDTKILSDKFQIKVNDLIALPNLNIIPPEKLDVTVFEPDDEIVFSNPKKCRQEFLSEMKEVENVYENHFHG